VEEGGPHEEEEVSVVVEPDRAPEIDTVVILSKKKKRANRLVLTATYLEKKTRRFSEVYPRVLLLCFSG